MTRRDLLADDIDVGVGYAGLVRFVEKLDGMTENFAIGMTHGRALSTEGNEIPVVLLGVDDTSVVLTVPQATQFVRVLQRADSEHGINELRRERYRVLAQALSELLNGPSPTVH